MVNAWALAASILDGTFDEDYPIMDKSKGRWTEEDEIREMDDYPLREEITSLESEDTEPTLHVGPQSAPESPDSITIKTNPDLEWVEKSGGFEWTPGSPWPPNVDLADVDDRAAHHFTNYEDAMMPGIEEDHRKWIYESPDGGKTVYRRTHGQDPMTRELVPQKDSNTGLRNERPDGDFNRVFYKYKEDIMLDEAKNYIATTYGSHYTSNDGIQTLDLIQGIGDAEAFCRSNAIKYLSRFGKKDGKSKVDILKAIHYCTLLYHFAGLHDEN
jgi:hypothetical protein